MTETKTISGQDFVKKLKKKFKKTQEPIFKSARNKYMIKECTMENNIITIALDTYDQGKFKMYPTRAEVDIDVMGVDKETKFDFSDLTTDELNSILDTLGI